MLGFTHIMSLRTGVCMHTGHVLEPCSVHAALPLAMLPTSCSCFLQPCNLPHRMCPLCRKHRVLVVHALHNQGTKEPQYRGAAVSSKPHPKPHSFCTLRHVRSPTTYWCFEHMHAGQQGAGEQSTVVILMRDLPRTSKKSTLSRRQGT